MRLASISKKIIPNRIRQQLGIRCVKYATMSRITIGLLSLLLDSCYLNLKMLPENKCSFRCNNRDIISYRDGFRTFSEIFIYKIYEQFWKPKEGNIILDIGAYVGMFSFRASGLVGENGIVLAIEPDQANLSLARTNLRKLKNIRIIPAAVSDRNGLCKLYISENTACHSIGANSSKKAVMVKSMTVDTLVKEFGLPRVDIIKIDAEGAELLILEGATETLKQNVKLSIACYHDLPNHKPEKQYLKDYLVKLGFRVKIHNECLFADRT